MRAPRFAVQAGLDDDIVFWRDQGLKIGEARPAPQPSHLMTFRAGGIYRP